MFVRRVYYKVLGVRGVEVYFWFLFLFFKRERIILVFLIIYVISKVILIV